MTDNGDQSRARTARVTKAEKLAPEVARLESKGLGRNAIAERLGCSVGTVTNAAKHAGVTFDRAATRQAVEAAQVDAKADRAAIDEKVRANANRALTLLLEALSSIQVVTAADARALAATATSLLSTHFRLAEFDREPPGLSPSDAQLWLSEMLGRDGPLPPGGTDEQLDAADSVAEFEQLLGD